MTAQKEQQIFLNIDSKTPAFVKPVVAGFVLLASMLLWAFFLNNTGLSMESLAGVNGFEKIFEVVFNFDFLLFIVFFPLTAALLSGYVKIFEKKEMYAITVGSFVVFALISFLFFSKLLWLAIPGIGLLVGMILAIEVSRIKFEELKHLEFMRVSMSAIGQVNLVVGIALFISAILFVLPMQQEIITKVEDRMLSYFVKEDVQDDLTEATTKIFVEGQKQTAQALVSNPAFTALSRKTDPEVQVFVIAANSAVEQLNSPEYFSQVQAQFKEQAGQQLSPTDLKTSFNQVKQNFPLLLLIEENYWLLFAFIIASTYLFIANVFFKPLAGLYGFVLGQFIQNLEKTTPQ